MESRAEYQKRYRRENAERIKAQRATYRELHREEARQKTAAWRVENKERARASVLEYGRKNRERLREYFAKYRAENPELIKERKRTDYLNNMSRYRHSARMRRQKELQATPAWANLDEMNRIYKAAAELREMGFDVEVDHDVPLRSPLVSGLHCEHNLQIVSKATNRTKGNKFNPETYDPL